MSRQLKLCECTEILFLGKVGMVLNTEYFQPASNKTEDIVAAENALQFTVRLVLNKSSNDIQNTYSKLNIQNF